MKIIAVYMKAPDGYWCERLSRSKLWRDHAVVLGISAGRARAGVRAQLREAARGETVSGRRRNMRGRDVPHPRPFEGEGLYQREQGRLL